jgi:hypothetical protein
MFEVTEPKPELRASERFHCVRGVKHVTRQFILYSSVTELKYIYWIWPPSKSKNVSI